MTYSKLPMRHPLRITIGDKKSYFIASLNELKFFMLSCVELNFFIVKSIGTTSASIWRSFRFRSIIFASFSKYSDEKSFACFFDSFILALAFAIWFLRSSISCLFFSISFSFFFMVMSRPSIDPRLLSYLV